MNPKISIIIPHLFGVEYLVNCLESIFKSDYSDFEVIVVFNGNKDGSYEVIKKKFPSIISILNKKNEGYDKANNQGIERSCGQIIFLLSDDTTIHPHLISTLQEQITSDPKIGIVGPKIYYATPPDRIWFAGGAIDWENQTTYHLGKNEQDQNWHDQKKEVDFITGCALMIKREVIEKIGMLDEVFFAYYEDTDWCEKAKKAGYKMVYVPFGGVWHVKSATSSSIFFGKEKNRTFLWLIPVYLWRCARGSFRLTRNKFIFFNRYLPQRFRKKFLLKSLFITLPSLVWELTFHIPKSLVHLALKRARHSSDFS